MWKVRQSAGIDAAMFNLPSQYRQYLGNGMSDKVSTLDEQRVADQVLSPMTMSESTPNMSGPVADSKSKKKRKNKKKGAHPAQNDTSKSQVENKPTEVAADNEDHESDASEPEPEESDVPRQTGTSTETSVDDEVIAAVTNGVDKATISETGPEDATARFDALVKDRDALRAEVTQLRQSLEEIRAKHEEEIGDVQVELKETQEEKERAEEEYQNLLGKVNTIRSQLGERLKADAEELAQARTLIEELEEQKSELQEQYTIRSGELEELASKNQEQERELKDLRNRSNLSQQNWVKEREELVESEAYIREEFENAKIAMHDWEVLATEERQVRRDLERRVGDLEEQLNSVKTDYERAVDERDTQSSTVDGLHKALQEIQDARRRELREMVENSQHETQTLRKQLEDIQSDNEKSKVELDEMKKELERTAPFEKEVKEKNLQIGKLRHEGVILSDHLTKALRFLKKGRPEDNVDRQIVTNHFLQFLSLDRSDPKKFQILQIISGILNWSDEEREQAGLARPGGSSASNTGSLRLPKSSFHRAPSTPSLTSGDFFGSEGTLSPGSTGKESLAELWQSFLEQEASSTQGSRGSASRRDSTTSAAPHTSPKV